MIVYKGTDKDMKCRGFQFDLGKEYVEEEAKLCDKGFHGCEYPLDVFAHYAPADSRFFVADLDGVTDEEASRNENKAPGGNRYRWYCKSCCRVHKGKSRKQRQSDRRL